MKTHEVITKISTAVFDGTTYYMDMLCRTVKGMDYLLDVYRSGHRVDTLGRVKAQVRNSTRNRIWDLGD